MVGRQRLASTLAVGGSHGGRIPPEEHRGATVNDEVDGWLNCPSRPQRGRSAPCNYGWMAHLEDACDRCCDPSSTAAAIHHANGQRALATWAVKTAEIFGDAADR